MGKSATRKLKGLANRLVTMPDCVIRQKYDPKGEGIFMKKVSKEATGKVVPRSQIIKEINDPALMIPKDHGGLQWAEKTDKEREALANARAFERAKARKKRKK